MIEYMYIEMDKLCLKNQCIITFLVQTYLLCGGYFPSLHV